MEPAQGCVRAVAAGQRGSGGDCSLPKREVAASPDREEVRQEATSEETAAAGAGLLTQ